MSDLRSAIFQNQSRPRPVLSCVAEFVTWEVFFSMFLFLSLCSENDITSVLDHTFCVEHNAFGKFLQHELKPNGRNIPVTEENKKEYVR